MSARRRAGPSSPGLRPPVPVDRRQRPAAAGVDFAPTTSEASPASVGIGGARRKRKPRFVL